MGHASSSSAAPARKHVVLNSRTAAAAAMESFPDPFHDSDMVEVVEPKARSGAVHVLILDSDSDEELDPVDETNEQGDGGDSCGAMTRLIWYVLDQLSIHLLSLADRGLYFEQTFAIISIKFVFVCCLCHVGQEKKIDIFF